MLETSARLLRLLALLQARSTWTGPDLVERLEVTDRTLRRDVDRLRALGYPVHSTSGRAGGYMLGAGASLPPLMLDDGEGLAVALGLVAGAAAVAGLGDASQRALAKLEQVMPPRLRRRLAALRATVIRMPDASPTVALAAVDALASACADHRIARFRYQDHGGAGSERVVEPHRLVLVGRRWYLAAWDQGRGDWRTFRVDRIAAPVTIGDGFVPHPAPDEDVGAYVSRSVTKASHRYQVRAILEAPAEAIRARVPPAYGEVEPLGPRRCRLVTGSSSLDGAAAWLAILAERFEVESPPELAAHVAVLADRLTRSRGAPTPPRRAGSPPRRGRTATPRPRRS